MRIKNRWKIVNKVLRYFKAKITIYQDGIMQIREYDRTHKWEWKYDKEIDDLFTFECMVCNKDIEINLRKPFLSKIPAFDDVNGFPELSILIEHVKKEHPKIVMVKRCFLNGVKKELGANISYSHYYWLDVNGFDGLYLVNPEPLNPHTEMIYGKYKNCRICHNLNKKFQWCKFHLEFIKYPKKLWCISFNGDVK